MYIAKLFITVAFLCFSSFGHAEWVPFKFKNNHIVVPVEINGQKVEAILDSGANVNMINKNFVKKYGKNYKRTDKIRIKGVNGSSFVQLYNNIPVKMFGGKFDLDNIAEGELGEETLLLSSVFFSKVIMQIDFPNAKLQFFPRDAIDMDKYENVPMKRIRSSNLPAIKVSINDKKVWLTFDTGNSGAIYVKRSLAINENWLNEKTHVTKMTTKGISRAAKVEQFSVNSLKIGPYELESVPIQVPAEDENTNVGESRREVSALNNSRISRGIKTKGIMGFDILKHFIVTVDLKNYQLHIVLP